MPDNGRMVRIPVFRFEIFDRGSRAWAPAPYLATEEHIQAFGGVALPGSRRLVPKAEVDAVGIYREVLPEA